MAVLPLTTSLATELALAGAPAPARGPPGPTPPVESWRQTCNQTAAAQLVLLRSYFLLGGHERGAIL